MAVRFHRFRLFLFARFSLFVPVPRFSAENFAPGSSRSADRKLGRPQHPATLLPALKKSASSL